MSNSTTNHNDVRLKDVILKLISIKQLLWQKKLKIIIFSLILGLLGSVYAHFKQETYVAHLTFVIDENQESAGLGAISGMASQIGFNLAGVSSGTFSQTNIQEIITSRRVVEEALLKRGIIDGKEDLLINHHIAFNDLRKKWKSTNIENLYFTSNREEFTLQHDSILGLAFYNLTEDNISTSIEDESNIVKITCVSKNQDFAKLMIESLAHKLEEYYTIFQTAKSKNTLDFISLRADSVLLELKNAEYRYASYKDANFGVQRAKGLLEEIRLKRDVEILNIMYGELVKNLEISKFTLLNNKPLLNIIDSPTLPLEVNKIPIVIAFILFLILGSLLYSFILVVKQILNEEMS
ncbi:Wzz/FepE/Etk N-terminal domain-containing protein [Flavobacteriales bacterium]|nr:Wzz/FepE/Etk N-terminal domain-containing protein [Flavobacteriales bacterium]